MCCGRLCWIEDQQLRSNLGYTFDCFSFSPFFPLLVQWMRNLIASILNVCVQASKCMPIFVFYWLSSIQYSCVRVHIYSLFGTIYLSNHIIKFTTIIHEWLSVHIIVSSVFLFFMKIFSSLRVKLIYIVILLIYFFPFINILSNQNIMNLNVLNGKQ